MTCSYEFDLHEYDRDERELAFEDLGVEDGVWTCPHDAEPDADHCVFHRPPLPGEETRQVDRLLEQVNYPASTDRTDRKRARQFIGAVFDEVTLRDLLLSGPDMATLDLRHCRIGGALRLEQVTIDHPVDLSGATVLGETTFDAVAFRRGLRAENTTFRKAVTAARTDITGEADFARATFEADGLFDETEFDVGPSFARATVDGALRFDGSRIGYRQNANFYDCTVGGTLGFRKVTAETGLTLAEVGVGDRLTFEKARVDGELEVGLEPPAATDPPLRSYEFDDAHIEQVDVRLRETDVKQYLSFAAATISAGRIAYPVDESAAVDVRDATLGDVTFSPQADAADPLAPLAHVFVFRTDFEEFDFTDTTLQFDRYPAELHTVAAGCREIVSRADERKGQELAAAVDEELRLGASADAEAVDYQDLIATYLKAKTGADAVGAARLAGKFYKREMDYRWERDVRRLRTDVAGGGISGPSDLYGTLLTVGGALENRFLRTTTAYGESPIRVIAWMVVTIGLFAGVFAAAGVDAGVTVPIPFGGQLLFSAQSFVALFLGAVPESGDVTGAVAVASTVEGFLGALFIALFVFTLTRRIHR